MPSIKEERTTAETNTGRKSRTAIGNAAKRVAAFHEGFIDGLEKITQNIDEKTQLLNDKQLELRFIQEKELPEALEKKYVEGDEKDAKRLLTLEAKLQKDITELQEEILVITNLKAKYTATKAAEANALVDAFNSERDAAALRSYRRLEAAKRVYLEAIKEEADSLHEYRGIDLQLAEILEEGGLKKPLSYLPVLVAPRREDHGYHKESYLEVPTQVIKDIITGRVDEEYHIGYLPTRG
ncbi:hypothetical protein [Bacillus cereus]|uniref:Uncharacterized protein n=1 Tax=Bacillus cereus TaxID=1396 RepID=A0AA44QBY5_BACCE|nr:hypothetical protein [Bacillus cereus]PFN08267.1 hypothetical protein COJ55_07005 [Bacillus cereus]PFS02704.1 hypothetical protein COK38_09075 [Bacillus cereus]